MGSSTDTLLKNITGQEDLKNYLRRKGENHRSYKTYSNQRFIREIINEQRIYLNDGSNWNDVADREAFNDEHADYKNYGKCFSFSDSESVAMWMLYGGIDNCGAMISFTKRDMKKIFDIDHVILGSFIDGTFVEYSRLNKGFFDIKLVDILYTRKEKDGYYIKRGNEVRKVIDDKLIQALGKECIKDVAWSYENECRLVVSIKKEYIKKEETVVKIDISSFNFEESFSRVFHSPTFKGEQTYSKSELQGYIDWDLCSSCTFKR